MGSGVIGDSVNDLSNILSSTVISVVDEGLELDGEVGVRVGPGVISIKGEEERERERQTERERDRERERERDRQRERE